MGKINKLILKIVGGRYNVATWISFGLFFYLVLYFSYKGITTSPATLGHDIDSIVYHIPIAQNLAKGNFLPPDLRHGLGYYPAVGESILAVFIILGIPLNLFNVLGLFVLFIVSRILAQRFGLNNLYSTVFAASVASLNSVTRLVNNQTIDVWLVIFYLLCLYLLIKPQKKISYFLLLGISFGLLIGVKYSGIVFAAVLALFFFRNVIRKLNIARFLALGIPIIIFGFSWYIRNYALTGNPIYPGSVFGFEKHPDFITQGWYPIQTLFYYPGAIVLIITALISEYLIWMITLILPFLIIYLDKLRSLNIDKNIKLLSFLGIANFAVFFFLPSNPGAIVSDVRYLFPSLIPLMLASFLLAKKFNKLPEISTIAILSASAVLPQFEFRPKLAFIWLTIMSGVFIYINFLKHRLKPKL